MNGEFISKMFQSIDITANIPNIIQEIHTISETYSILFRNMPGIIQVYSGELSYEGEE